MNFLQLVSFTVMSSTITVAYSQNQENSQWESVLETLLWDEDLTSDAREELAFMYESIHESPLNINTATREELARLPFLTYAQIEDIHAYIYLHGPMLSLGELQLTGSLDYNTRRLLREFVFAGEIPVKREKLQIKDLLRNGRNEVVTRMDIPLYLRDGFRSHSPQELERYPNREYLGCRLSHSLRYSFNWHDRIRLGITADEDAGEPFLGLNKTGYDFWSPYLYIKDLGLIKELVLGSFKAQFGHGLLLGSGFSSGKNLTLTSMERPVRGLRPHASTQEYGYLRGVGATVGRSHTTFTLLAASTPLDATLNGDTLISSFKEDGYHRTLLEWSKKHNVTLGTLAADISYNYRGLRFGNTLLIENLSLPFKGRDRFLGFSTYCSVNRSRHSFTSELSFGNGKPALIASHTIRLNGKWILKTLFRHYSPEYYSLHANAMAEGSVQNETGLLIGFSHNGRNLKIDGYTDLFIHPEPRTSASRSSKGMDCRIEADWTIGHRDELFVTARIKTKQKDCKPTNQLEYCITGRYRLRWTHSCSNGTELKTQLHYTRYDFIAEPISHGWAVTHTCSRSFLKDNLILGITAVAFHTDSYDSRISVYENGLRYSYNFMTMYGKGGRLSVTFKYKPWSFLELDVKAGSTCYLDRDEISSAQQRISSSHKEDIYVQLTVKF